MIKSEYNNIKIILRVKLIGQRTVKIHVLRVHPNIYKYDRPTFFYNEANNYIYYKYKDRCEFYRDRFIIPTNPKEKSSLCSFVFKSNRERQEVLGRFTRSLLDLSKGGHFILENQDYPNNRIEYLGDKWIVY